VVIGPGLKKDRVVLVALLTTELLTPENGDCAREQDWFEHLQVVHSEWR